MNIENIRSIIQDNRNDIAFVIGNGINRYFNSEVFSWKDLLCSLWKEMTNTQIRNIPGGISYTEFVDVLDLKTLERNNIYDTKNNYRIQKKLRELFLNFEPNRDQNIVFNKIREIDSPILTTNFDNLIQKSMNLDFYKITKKGFTDFYPWECYFSDQKVLSPIDGFSLWHINGMIKYFRSLKISMTQYMGNVERARKMIYSGDEDKLFTGKNHPNWAGKNSWLHIIFNKSLFIFGLELSETEVFFRWLLIERAKYFKVFPERAHNSWYIDIKKENESIDVGKKFFLENIGFELIEVDNYDEIYTDIWLG